MKGAKKGKGYHTHTCVLCIWMRAAVGVALGRRKKMLKSLHTPHLLYQHLHDHLEDTDDSVEEEEDAETPQLCRRSGLWVSLSSGSRGQSGLQYPLFIPLCTPLYPSIPLHTLSHIKSTHSFNHKRPKCQNANKLIAIRINTTTLDALDVTMNKGMYICTTPEAAKLLPILRISG